MTRLPLRWLLAGLALGIGGWPAWFWRGRAASERLSAERAPILAAKVGVAATTAADDTLVDTVYSPLADELHAARFDEAHDLAVLRGLLGQFTTTLRLAERPPLGDNADIAAALTGGNRRRVVFIPPGHPALRAGVLVDRAGVPYHFHARSADAIDVRSAGPDRVLFTTDDLVSP